MPSNLSTKTEPGPEIPRSFWRQRVTNFISSRPAEPRTRQGLRRRRPRLKKLHTKYAGDSDVVILTINNDSNSDEVPPWIKQKDYSFAVLLDDAYVGKTGVRAFPTTWFLDPQGRKAFEKVGWSEKLLEEFSWRIEALRSAMHAPNPPQP